MDDKKLNWKDLLRQYTTERVEVQVVDHHAVEDTILAIKRHAEEPVPQEMMREFLEEVKLLQVSAFYRVNHALVMPGNATIH